LFNKAAQHKQDAINKEQKEKQDHDAYKLKAQQMNMGA